ncbi:hypothetical protein TOL_3732 [Thalassolituus oleivorans MIL-1]|uniref:Uncharacterized protein n=1 Tax=Thalassolituus oleivorans MIL-1 TaxID=1298593 RepID=M5DX04_9GAMM|nr:hypothetical protein TOL_3732 [Thalassolituus oleivorans MIL-1]
MISSVLHAFNVCTSWVKAVYRMLVYAQGEFLLEILTILYPSSSPSCQVCYPQGHFFLNNSGNSCG